MKPSHLLFCVFVCLSAVALAPASAFQNEAAAPRTTAAPPASERIFDLQFRGGSAADFAVAVRNAVPGLNVVIAPEAAEVPMPAVELKGVSAGTALRLIHQRGFDTPSHMTRLVVETIMGEHGERIYAVRGSTHRRAPDVARESGVWSVMHLINAGVKTEDMLTAIQTAVDLERDTNPEVQLKFHDPTGIILGRGTTSQLALIQQVIDRLSEGQRVINLQQRVREQADRIETLQNRIRELEREAQTRRQN